MLERIRRVFPTSGSAVKSVRLKLQDEQWERIRKHLPEENVLLSALWEIVSAADMRVSPDRANDMNDKSQGTHDPATPPTSQ
jgi:hypothetical protein